MLKYANLREELIDKRGEIYTNQLTMSVGEIINLYEHEEINLEPNFQRLFRWNDNQKTNFIESILLGYPIPAIFVLQRENGVWDVIDGVQRLSTIYEFVGILKKDSEKDKCFPPLKLESAKILKYLEGKFFYCKEEDSLDIATRIDFKRSTFPVIILKHGSDKKSKYELFKRLNTGGSHLSPQEIRNALILMFNEDIYFKMIELCEKEIFKELLSLSNNKLELRMDLDIITRYIVMRNYKNLNEVSNTIDINDFLDDAIQEIISNPNYDITEDIEVFNKLITFLYNEIDIEYGFKVFDKESNRFKGPFNWLIFEMVIWGLTIINDISIIDVKKEEVIECIKCLKGTGEFLKDRGVSNLKVIKRLKEAKIEAKEIFNFGR